MKKWISFLLSILLVGSVSIGVFAAEFHVDEYAVIDTMEKSIYQGYAPVIKNNTMTVCLPIRAEKCVGDITASIALDDPNVFLLSGEAKPVTVSQTDGIYPVNLSLPLEKNRRNGDFPATITLSGADASGNAITQTIPYVLRIRDGYPCHESLSPVLSDVSASLDVGSDGSVSVTITNPTTTLSLTNGEITLTDASGDILMSGSERLNIGEILPGESKTVTIPTTIRANASISTHTVEIALSYDVLGARMQWTERFTLPVTQAIRLEHGAVDLPSAIEGELSNLSISLMNMGKGELHNVLVKLSVDDALGEQSVLVGTIASGESKQAKLTFTPVGGSVGTHRGTVTITCEDAYANASSEVLDVVLCVEEPVQQDEITQEDTEKAQPSIGTTILGIICIVLMLAFAIRSMLLTKKLHTLEEERL